MAEELCVECGKPSYAKGLCRKHYDGKRLIVMASIKPNIREYVRELSEENRWSMSHTINYLIDGGLKWHRKKEAVKEEFEL